MSDSRTLEAGSAGADDGPERPPRYEQMIRWAECITEQPPEVWGPQQNAVVSGQIESAQAVDVSAEDEKRVREFADEALLAEGKSDEGTPNEEWVDTRTQRSRLSSVSASSVATPELTRPRRILPFRPLLCTMNSAAPAGVVRCALNGNRRRGSRR